MYGHELMCFNPSLECTVPKFTNTKDTLRKVRECGVILFSSNMNDILVVLQNYSKKWGFPKGHMTHTELYNKEYFNCAKRELLEETSIDLRRISHTKYGTFIIGNKLFYVIELKKTNIEPRINDREEISKVRWIRKHDLCTFVEQNSCNMTLNRLF